MTESRTGQGPASADASAVPSVPQQFGHAQQRSEAQDGSGQRADQAEYDSQAAGYDVPGDSMLAAAARRSWPAVLLGGACMAAVGIILLVWPSATLTVVAVLIGIALVVSGLVKLFEGFTARSESGGMRTAYVVIGLLAVLAGLYCLRHHALSLFLVAFVTGVYFIMHGIADLGVAFSGRVPGRGLRAVIGVASLAAGIIIIAWPGVSLVLLLTIVAAWLIFYGIVLASLAFSLRRAGRALTRGRAGTVVPAG
jgi:uncharacterized membrane protein HdeD (DUF308 family)